MYDDIREFIDAVDKVGELLRIDGVRRDEELGPLTEAVAELLPGPPLVLYDGFDDFPRGYRVVTGLLASPRRAAMALGLDPELPKVRLIREATKVLREAVPLPPTVVDDGPVLANTQTGDSVDVTGFPTSLFGRSDGGRFLGSGDLFINRDRVSGYVNVGTYRMQVHEKDLLGLWASPGQQGRAICEQFWAEGKACPVAATFGGDPLTFMVSAQLKLPWGESELDFAGGIRRRPLEVVEGPLTGLPIPAHAEIAIEGEIPPPSVESREEGPYGEWTGYYSGGSAGVDHEPQPVVRVKAVYHRDDPILSEEAPLWPGAPRLGLPITAGLLWDQLESVGIGGIVGVNIEDLSYFVVIALRQQYPGHAKQVGHAAISCSAVARHGRYVVIVDDDIDPTNMREVMWAMETRVDPARDIELVDGMWSTPLDPTMPPAKRQNKDFTSSRAIYYAVRPFIERHTYPRISRSSPEQRAHILDKYREVFARFQ